MDTITIKTIVLQEDSITEVDEELYVPSYVLFTKEEEKDDVCEDNE